MTTTPSELQVAPRDLWTIMDFRLRISFSPSAPWPVTFRISIPAILSEWIPFPRQHFWSQRFWILDLGIMRGSEQPHDVVRYLCFLASAVYRWCNEDHKAWLSLALERSRDVLKHGFFPGSFLSLLSGPAARIAFLPIFPGFASPPSDARFAHGHSRFLQRPSPINHQFKGYGRTAKVSEHPASLYI